MKEVHGVEVTRADMLLLLMDVEAISLQQALHQRFAKFAMTYRRKIIDDYAPYSLPLSSIVVIEAIAPGADTPSKIVDRLSQVRPRIRVLLTACNMTVTSAVK